MSSGSERTLSLEELRQRNLPPPQTELHPTAEEWDELLEMLSALYRLTAARELKIAHGHAEDDHEEYQGPKLSM